MRPEKAKRIIQRAIDSYLNGDSSRLYKALPALHKWYMIASRNEREYPDVRCGYESYGYGNRESIFYQMMYISDRWRCMFRIRWLLDGVVDRKF